MKCPLWIRPFAVCVLVLSLAGGAGAQGHVPKGDVGAQSPVGTAFTYQGQLADGGRLAQGDYDFRFILYDTDVGGAQVGGTLYLEDLLVEDGCFAVELDFGAGVFTGDARFLEVAVRPWDSTDPHTTLSPRQPLTATPYALYARAVSWSGVTGVPADLADGDDDTTYSPGVGLNLVGTQFRVSFGGSGTTNSVARADHHHLGQTWTGSGNPLVIEGSFGGVGDAPLVMSNSAGHALRIASAASNGVHISSADENGVYVDSAGSDGMYVSSAGDDGVHVQSAGSDGVYVSSADDDGMHVHSAGTPSTTDASSLSNGLEVAGAEGNGLYVGRSDNHGVHVESAGNDGVRVDDAYQDGVQIGDGADYPLYGLYIPAPGTPHTALWPNTANVNGEWALYTPDKISAGNVTASSMTLVARVAGPDELTTGDLVAVVGMGDPLPGTLSSLPSVGLAIGSLDGIIGVVEGSMVLQPAAGKEDGAMSLVSVAGPARTGGYVALTVFGIAEVKVGTQAAGIAPGQRLTASDAAGHARGLRSEMLNGMLVTEGAPVIGIALAAPTPGSNTIPVFVTLR